MTWLRRVLRGDPPTDPPPPRDITPTLRELRAAEVAARRRAEAMRAVRERLALPDPEPIAEALARIRPPWQDEGERRG